MTKQFTGSTLIQMSDRIFLVSCLLIFLVFRAGPVWAAESKGSKPVYVQLTTNLGDIVLELDSEKAPLTVENFKKYVEAGHYDGTVFHRVIADFMIQGGGYTEDFKEKKTEAAIKNEADNGLTNNKHTVAMARTTDPHSATAQFFINVKDNDFLNFSSPTVKGYGYAVFGKVVKGQDVVDKIKMVETTSQSFHDDVPKEAVLIEKAAIIQAPEDL